MHISIEGPELTVGNFDNIKDILKEKIAIFYKRTYYILYIIYNFKYMYYVNVA